MAVTGEESMPTEIRAVRTAMLDAPTRAAIIELCILAHDEEDFRNLFAYLPDDGLHVLAWAPGELVGHAATTIRWLQPGGLPLLRTAYVDAVAIAPGRQGRGVGSAMMRHLASLVGDCQIACLETERTSFYEQLGWEEWRGPLAGRSADGVIPTPDQRGIMILRLPSTPPLDLEAPLTIEADGRIW